MSLVFNIFPDDIGYNSISNTPDEIAIIPQFSCPQLLPKFGKLLEYLSGRYTFHYLYHFGWRISRWCSHEDMHMVFHDPYRIYFKFIFLGYLFKHFFEVFFDFSIQYIFPIFWYPYQVIFQFVDCMFCPFYSHAVFIPVIKLFGKPFLRLTANHFHPPSKLRGIQ
jgi:hypothetical protein